MLLSAYISGKKWGKHYDYMNKLQVKEHAVVKLEHSVLTLVEENTKTRGGTLQRLHIMEVVNYMKDEYGCAMATVTGISHTQEKPDFPVL